MPITATTSYTNNNLFHLSHRRIVVAIVVSFCMLLYAMNAEVVIVVAFLFAHRYIHSNPLNITGLAEGKINFVAGAVPTDTTIL